MGIFQSHMYSYHIHMDAMYGFAIGG